MMDKGSVDLDIVIPVTSDLHLNGSAGSINLTGVAGQIAIETNAGGIYVSLPRASSLAITSKTDFGSIHNQFGSDMIGMEPRAPLTLNTNFGSIHIGAV